MTPLSGNNRPSGFRNLSRAENSAGEIFFQQKVSGKYGKNQIDFLRKIYLLSYPGCTSHGRPGHFPETIVLVMEMTSAGSTR